MKNLIKKILKENFKVPHYSKGEILIFPHERHKHMDISSMAKELGYEVDVESEYEFLPDGDFYLIKTPIGREKEAGQDFVDNYPEFISSYERRDLRLEELYNRLDVINDMFGNLQYGVGDRIMNNDWNKNIDIIIQELNSLKF